jgi:hypothetical protein
MKRVALTRVLLARLLGGSLSQGSPFGLLSFEVMRDKNGLMKSFYFSENFFIGLTNFSCKRVLIFGETLCENVCLGLFKGKDTDLQGERKRKRGAKEKYDEKQRWRACFRNIESKKIDHAARAQTTNLERPLRREHEMEKRTQTNGGLLSRYPRTALVIVCINIVWREGPRAGEACTARLRVRE